MQNSLPDVSGLATSVFAVMGVMAIVIVGAVYLYLESRVKKNRWLIEHERLHREFGETRR